MAERRLPVVESGRSFASRPDAASKRKLPVLLDPRAQDRAARPIYAVWEITLRCDLACRHCGSRAGMGRPDELTTSEALDLVDQMAELGVEEVSLIGGETYLRDDWLEIAGRVRDRGMICGIVTGGRGVTLERARGAKAAGVQGMSVSVDGLEATHDHLRGAVGSHEAALAALGALREVGLVRSANTQVNQRNFREIPAVLELLAPTGIHAWQVQFTVAMARAADDPSVLLQPYQLIEVMPMIAALKHRSDELGVRLWSGNNVGYYGPYERLLHEGSPGDHHVACAAGSLVLGVEANGDIKGCPSLPTADYVGGNVRDRRLREIWEGTEPLRFTRGRTVEDLWGFCRSCYYAEDCLAGCSWTAHMLFGRRGNNPYCHHRALELLREGKRERLVQVEAPPGSPFDRGLFELVLEDWPAGELALAEAIARTGQGSLPPAQEIARAARRPRPASATLAP